MDPQTPIKIVQSGSQLRLSGSVITLIDGFELGSVTLGKVTNKTAVVLAQVTMGKHVNIFASGEVKFDVTLEVPEKLERVQVVVNGAYDATFDVTHEDI